MLGSVLPRYRTPKCQFFSDGFPRIHFLNIHCGVGWNWLRPLVIYITYDEKSIPVKITEGIRSFCMFHSTFLKQSFLSPVTEFSHLFPTHALGEEALASTVGRLGHPFLLPPVAPGWHSTPWWGSALTLPGATMIQKDVGTVSHRLLPSSTTRW